MSYWCDGAALNRGQARLDAEQARAKEKMKAKQTPPVGVYYEGDRHHCQFCNGVHWYIGRIHAECANETCGNAVPLAEISQQPEEPRFTTTQSKTA